MFTDGMTALIDDRLRKILTSSTSLLESEKDDVICQLTEVLKAIGRNLDTGEHSADRSASSSVVVGGGKATR